MKFTNARTSRRLSKVVRVMAVMLAVVAAFTIGAGTALAVDGCPTCLPYRGCVDDYQSDSVCTANDVRISSINVLSYFNSDSCMYVGDTTQVYLQSQLVAGAKERYDVSLFIALDGGSAQLPSRTAQGASCYHDFMTPIMGTAGAYNPTSGIGPYWNAEYTTPLPADTCGDIQQGVYTYYNLDLLTLPCIDADNDGQVDAIGTCVGWDNQSNQSPVCQTVTDAYPNTKSKCRCEPIVVPELDIRKIVVDKVTIPSADPELFTFNIYGPSPAGPFQLADLTTPYYHLGVLAQPGYSVVETVPTGWTLTDSYCVAQTGANTYVSYQPSAIDMTMNIEVRCTFTNTKSAHIIVDKVTDPSGATQQFEFDPSWSGTNFFLADGTTPANSGPLFPGTYSVAEVNIPADWDLTSATCSDGSPITAINLAPGEVVTCTFTNAIHRGSITIIKEAAPEGPTDFPFTSTGGLVPANFSLDDDADGTLLNTRTFNNLLPGYYTVSESPVSGWALYSIVCTDPTLDTTVVTPTVQINLNPGESVTCTFYNGDPTAVTLRSFNAVALRNGIQLTWQTANELDNLGYNVYRAMKLNGPRVKLNAVLIPSKVAPGSPFGAAYSLVDGVPPKSTYYYWLEDVDIYGVRTLHGPVPVTMGQ